MILIKCQIFSAFYEFIGTLLKMDSVSLNGILLLGTTFPVEHTLTMNIISAPPSSLYI